MSPVAFCAVPVMSATVVVTSETTPSTVPSRVSATVVFVSDALSDMVSDAVSVAGSVAEREVAGSSSALATAEPSAHAPVTPAAMTMERRMFLFMSASDPWILGVPGEAWGHPEPRGSRGIRPEI